MRLGGWPTGGPPAVAPSGVRHRGVRGAAPHDGLRPGQAHAALQLHPQAAQASADLAPGGRRPAGRGPRRGPHVWPVCRQPSRGSPSPGLEGTHSWGGVLVQPRTNPLPPLLLFFEPRLERWGWQRCFAKMGRKWAEIGGKWTSQLRFPS